MFSLSRVLNAQRLDQSPMMSLLVENCNSDKLLEQYSPGPKHRIVFEPGAI